MALKQIVRAIEREARRQHQEYNRQQREIGRQYREAQTRQAQVSKEFQKAAAASDALAYEHYVHALINLHRGGMAPLDWSGIASAPAPVAPTPVFPNTAAVQQEVNAYNPGLLDRTLGRAKKRIAELELAVEHAKVADAQLYQQACAAHQVAQYEWHQQCVLASRVLARDMGAYREVLESWQIPSSLTPFGIQVFVARSEPDVVQYTAILDLEQNVPREQLSVTAAGKLSKKALSASNYWLLGQDHVCSVALRLARDTFALLPIDRVVVNVGGAQLDTSTGHMEPVTWLAVHASRGAFVRINLGAIDPSDAMANFQHRMKFKKSTGFGPVNPIMTDEHWVTT